MVRCPIQSTIQLVNHYFFRVFSGGGIGGASLSYMIHHYNQSHTSHDELPIEVHIFEGAPQFREIGAGLTVWPRTLKIMDAIGLNSRLNGGGPGYEEFATFPPQEAKS